MVIGDVSAPALQLDAAAEEEVTPEVESEQFQPVESRTGPPKPGLVAVVLACLFFMSVVALFLGIFALGLSGLQEHRSQQQLYAEFRQLLPGIPVAPHIGGHIPAGAPVALLDAPAAGIRNVVVVEGTSSSDLLAGPGHLSDTPLPGQGGESVLMGKSTTAGAPFGHLTNLRRGDLITVRTGQGLFSFTVRGRLVPGAHQGSISADNGRLVLVTSAGSPGLGELGGSRMIEVAAILHGKAVAAPPHRPTSVTASELPGHGDLAAWPFVLLWLGGLIVLSAVVWWLWWRWGLLRTWLVGAPVLLAVLWGLSNEVMRLLPNVY